MSEGEATDAQWSIGVGPLEPRRETMRPDGDRNAASVAQFPRPSGASARPLEGAVVSFDRRELSQIFNLYGRRVAEGEWRDYAIDFTALKAVFSIYRRASEVPLYRVEKTPALARRQGAYAVVAGTGLVLKRGSDLAQVLQVLDRRPKLVVV